MKSTIKDGIVNLHEKVTVYGTGESAYIPKGKPCEVHPLHADTLVKSGAATYDKKSKIE